MNFVGLWSFKNKNGDSIKLSRLKVILKYKKIKKNWNKNKFD